MKVILHGATNSSNFGDYLFAEIFYRKAKSVNGSGQNLFLEAPKFGIGEFFRKELGYTHKQTVGDLLTGDMLVYVSGGYFGERKGTLKESVKRYLRYLPIGLLFIARGKPVLILGVGGGPISNMFLRKSFVFLMNRAAEVSVRDEKTKLYFENYGVKKKMYVTSDTAQVIDANLLPELSMKKEFDNLFEGKKILFLHILGNGREKEVYLEKVIPALNNFFINNKDYGLVIGSDEVYNQNTNIEYLKTRITTDTLFFYNYSRPWDLCSLLNEVDVIITPKLHVGIVGATLSKSVISLPIHAEKTKRYYKQINEIGRCIPLEEVSSDGIEVLLNDFHDKKIILSDEVLLNAKKNLDILENAINRN